MLYEENCNLDFNKPVMAKDNVDIMYAFDEQDD